MVGVSCDKCGASYRFDDADVPPSGKIIKCARCGQSITVMPNGGAAMGLHSAGAGKPGKAQTVFGLGPTLAPGAAAGRAGAGPGAGAPPRVPGPGGKPAGGRPPLVPGPGGSRPGSGANPPRVPGPDGLGPAGATAKTPTARVPTPRTPTPSAGGEVPAAAADEFDSFDNLSVSDLIDLGDSSTSAGAPSGAAAGPRGLADLPAPVGPASTRHGITDLPAPVGPASAKHGITDLPAPVGPASAKHGITDLPAPVGPSSTRHSDGGPDRIDDVDGPVLSDLPAPVGPLPTRQTPDLPAPVGPLPTKQAPDLLAPVGPLPTRQAPDLLAPVGPLPTRQTPDLPAPVGPLPTKQLPDLLTPVGPTSTKNAPELPAPKGFFDDGVQPLSGPSKGGAGLPAPKGFFDDGVQPRSETPTTPRKSTAGARGAAAAPPSAQPSSSLSSLDIAVDLGSLEDPLPARGDAEGGAGPAAVSSDPFDLGDPIDFGDPLSGAGPGRPFGLDTDDLEMGQDDGAAPPVVPLELDDGPLGGGAGGEAGSDHGAPGLRDLDTGDPSSEPPLELELEASMPAGASGPSANVDPGGVVTFGRPSGKPSPRPSRKLTAPDPFAPARGGLKKTTELSLNLDTSSVPGESAPLPRAVKKRPRAAEATAAAAAKRSRSRRTLILTAVLGVGVVGAGGYYGWNAWHGHEQRKTRSSAGLRSAERLLADDSPDHWTAAAEAAKKVLARDARNTEALAVVAEANFAAALDEAPDSADRTAQGDKALDKLRSTSAKGPHAAKAEALRGILSGNLESAVKKLAKVVRSSPRDGNARLYQGWALSALDDHAQAVPAFAAALKLNPRRIPALYGLGLAELELGHQAKARTSLQGAIDQSRDRFKRDHLGALIGLARLAPPSEREGRYQELLARPDLDKAAPRQVARLRTRAGDEALRAGRIDQAKALYDQAHSLDPLNLRAACGLAEVALRTGDLAGARKKLEQDVLAVAPDQVEAAVILGQVDLAEGKQSQALARLTGLLERKPAIENPVLLAQVHLARAQVLEGSSDVGAQKQAEADFRAALAAAEPGDYSAAVGLADLLGKLGRGKEALTVLEPVMAAAKQDPDLALTLGRAYLTAGNTTEALVAFHSVLARRPGDAEAEFQIGQALYAQEKYGEAIDTLARAFAANPTREDIGIALARMDEQHGKAADAIQTYKKMLAGSPSLSARVRAGLFFARRGMHDEAMAQGDAIRAEDPDNPAGLFLLGEKLYAQKNYQEAQTAYRKATRLEPDAQFFEGLGRATQALGHDDEALREYAHAISLDPAYLAPRLGRGQVRLGRREYDQAIDELNAAEKIAPDNPAVVRDLGQAQLAMHNTQAAVPLLERAVRLDPDDPEAQFSLGSAYYDLDRARDAAGHLARAVEHAASDVPWRVEAYRLLGYAQRAAGSRAAAAKTFRAYLELDPKDSAQRRDVERLLLRLEAH